MRSHSRTLTRHKTASVRLNSECMLQTAESLRIQPGHASITVGKTKSSEGMDVITQLPFDL